MNKMYLNDRQIMAYRKRVLAEAAKLGVTKASRLYGIGRSTIYDWMRKGIDFKPMGPSSPVSWKTSTVLEAEVVKLKKETRYGPKRLKAELLLKGVKLGEKAIRGILERNDLVKKHRKKRVGKQKKFYTPYPGYRIQIDTKVVPDPGIDLRSGDRFQFSAIDTSSRIRFLMIYEELSNHNSLDFLKKVLDFFEGIGISVECVQTDNHMTFTNLFLGGNRKKDHQELRIHPFTVYCLEKGIEHLLSRPGRPQDNCFVERSHRTDGEEFYSFINLRQTNTEQLKKEISKWMFIYNFLRLHSSCDNLPPMKYYLTVRETGA